MSWRRVRSFIVRGGGFILLILAVAFARIGAQADWAMWVAAILGMAAAMWLGGAWMLSIDEAAQEAHKWSWYWGGCGGMAVGGVLVILATTPMARGWTVPVLVEPASPAAYAATGAMGMLLLMVAGYLLAWVLWWLRHR